MKFPVLFLAICLSLVSCTSVQQRHDEAVSRGVYSTQKAIRAGRFDLAKSYNDELTRIVPPPKHKVIDIQPIKKRSDNGSGETSFVVLPREFEITTSVATGSKTFDDLIKGDKLLERDEKNFEKDLNDFSNKNDQVLRDQEKERNKPKHSWWHIFSWVTRFGLIGIIIAVVAVVIFCPAIIPFVITILRTIAKGIGWLLRLLTTAIITITHGRG